ncbi:MAG: hypothetical protein BIFFINMI_03583 [Phycisphaerae bacterium]|nr:hypothetical protein [Phycisphaerae bacterium]
MPEVVFVATISFNLLGGRANRHDDETFVSARRLACHRLPLSECVRGGIIPEAPTGCKGLGASAYNLRRGLGECSMGPTLKGNTMTTPQQQQKKAKPSQSDAVGTLATRLARNELVDEVVSFAENVSSTLPPIYSLLRGHQYAEWLMGKIIRLSLPQPEKILTSDEREIGFNVKLRLLHGLGLISDDCANGLRQLNTLRNKCVHDFRRSITCEDVQKMKDSMGQMWGKDAIPKQVNDYLFAVLNVLGSYLSVLRHEHSQHANSRLQHKS